VIHELTRNDYEKVQPLFAGLDYQLITTAVLAGASPGTIWADNPDQPQAAFMASPEGYFLAGSNSNEAFNRSLNALIMGTILKGDKSTQYHEVIVVVCHPDDWEDKLDMVLRGQPPIKEQRMHFLLDRLQVDGQSDIQKGFAVGKIDENLLARPGLQIPEHVTGWMQTNWQSVDGFLQRAFGFCTVHDNEIVCWCMADCISGNACEIGIQTAEDYRRRGLATLTIAATVDYCLSHGLTTIGWHCHEDNPGSRGVAEKVGFVKERDYVHYLCIADEVDHLASLGWHCFQGEKYQEAVDWLEQAFNAGDATSWDYHTSARAWAILGDQGAALRYLEQAIESGWLHIEFTQRCKEFDLLLGLPQWKGLLARMEGGS